MVLPMSNSSFSSNSGVRNKKGIKRLFTLLESRWRKLLRISGILSTSRSKCRVQGKRLDT